MEFDKNEKNKLYYPCANPFSQLYLIPRDKLYVRFCPFHQTMNAIDDYENFGYEESGGMRIFAKNFLMVRKRMR